MKTGQTLLIMLVITGFIMVLMSAALVMSLAGTTIITGTSDAVSAKYGAEAGLEDGLMRILRNPSFTGETLTSGRATVTISVTGVGPYSITAVAVANGAKHTSRVQAQFTNGVMTTANWQDVY